MILQEQPTGAKLFGVFDIGPVSFYIFSVMVIVFFIIALKYIYSKGRGYIPFRGRQIYGKYTMIIVFTTFFVLSMLAKLFAVPLEDPVIMLIAFVFIIIFIGWTLTSDIRALQILFIALLGSFVGYIII
jgi:hypothetical protein